MKKLTLILLAGLMAVALPSCKNQGKKAADQAAPAVEQTEEEEDMAIRALKADAANFLESAKKVKQIPFLTAKNDGSLSLTDKELMVKPDYLLDPAIANNLVTLNQKYAVTSMLFVDQKIAEIYDMPTADFSAAAVKLLTEINDPAYTEFFSIAPVDLESNVEAFEIFVKQEYDEGRETFFWQAFAASMVEQVYVVTRDIDKFMPMFTDEIATDVTFNFLCLHDNLAKMVEPYPEMASLNAVLDPLYVIDAISVDQLRDQLLQVKSDIESARAYFLK